MWSIIAALILVILLCFIHDQRSAIRRDGKRLRRLPGTLPLAGYGIWFLRPRHTLLKWFAEIQPEVGFETFELPVPSLPPAVLISDPRNLEYVLKNTDLFVKGDFFRSRSWDLFADGILNVDGEKWRIQRKAGLRFLSNTNLEHFIDNVLPSLLNDTRKRLDKAARSGDVLDLQEELLELTTRFMGKVAYDMDMPSSLPFSKAFDYASGATGDRFTNPLWRLKEFFFGARLRAAIAEVKSFGDTIVTSAMDRRKQDDGPHSPEDPNPMDRRRDSTNALQSNLISSLLAHISTPSTVAASAMNFLSAGRDTTAQSLTWTFYALIRHPAAQARTVSALRAAFPSLDRTRPLPLTYAVVSSPLALPYLAAVFAEATRLYPAVPLEIKETTAAATLPDGTALPEGAVVVWVPYAMARNPRIWGPDAAAFEPLRWLEPDPDSDSDPDGEGRTAPGRLRTRQAFRTAYENPVFNAGPRMCIGKRMAEVLAAAVVGALAWEYVFDEARGPGEVGGERVGRNSLTLPMEGGLPVRVRRACPLSSKG